MLQSKITNRSTLATKWIQSHSNSHTQSQSISEITVPDEILMKRRILRSFFGYFVLLNILVNTVRTLNTDNTTKMPAYVFRMYTHTHTHTNTSKQYAHAHIHWSGADKQWRVPTLYSFTRFTVFAVCVCVCLFLSVCVRSCVQCMPKCWLTFKLGGCLQNNSFLLLYYKVNIYISSCESTHANTHTHKYVYNLESFPFRSCYTCWLQEYTVKFLLDYVCMCVCVAACVCAYTCVLLTHEAILVECFWTFLLVLCFTFPLPMQLANLLHWRFPLFVLCLSFIFIFLFILCTE